MPGRCVAVRCNEFKRAGTGISFHRFPKHPEVHSLWVKAIRRENWKPNLLSYVCSKHFIETDFDRTGQTIRLRKGSVPSVFEFPEHLQKKTKARKLPKQRQPLHSDILDEQDSETPAVELTDHNYTVTYSPRKLKRMLNDAYDEISKCKKKLNISQNSNRRLKRKISSLKDVLRNLKDNHLLDKDRCYELNTIFDGAPGEIFNCLLKKQKGGNHAKAYPEEVRKFAMALHYYSPRGYDYVRETFKLSLPHVKTLQKWSRNVSADPGFTDVAIEYLAQKVQEMKARGRKLIFTLAIDEMSIRDHLQVVGNKIVGYVDVGIGLESDLLPHATHALVFLLVAFNSSIKVPCAYFLINSMNASERASLITNCLVKLHQSDISVVNLTFDGTSVNFAMATELGAKLQFGNLRTHFVHPADENLKVHITLDPSHMIKLVRNTLGCKEVLFDLEGNEIKWAYIVELNNLQQTEGLHFANKLGNLHVHFKKQIMKVKLATQTLSSSVADALEFCNERLHLSTFQGCEATVKFIRTFDKLFDILNSRNVRAKGFKAPLNVENEHMWKSFFYEANDYISNLFIEVKRVRGGKQIMERQKLCLSQRKTGFIGFQITMDSVLSLFNSLVKEKPPVLRYFLTYKVSQDPIEHLFGIIRGKGGWNNNPTSSQFTAAYKQIVIQRNGLTPRSKQANCSIESDFIKSIQYQFHQRPDIDNSEADTDDDDDNVFFLDLIRLSIYAENILEYIAGYVVKCLIPKVNCTECRLALLGESTRPGFLSFKNKGGLLIPSQDVTFICRQAESQIRQEILLSETADFFPTSVQNINKLCTAVLWKLSDKELFTVLHDHMYTSTPEDNHVIKLIVKVVKTYVRIRMKQALRNVNEAKTRVRQVLTKAILFQHQ